MAAARSVSTSRRTWPGSHRPQPLREGAFADVRLVEALENTAMDGPYPNSAGTATPPNSERSYPGFRLYAESIYDVSNLKDDLTGQGIDVHQGRRHRAGHAHGPQPVGDLRAIAIIGLIGFSLSRAPACGPTSNARARTCRYCAWSASVPATSSGSR